MRLLCWPTPPFFLSLLPTIKERAAVHRAVWRRCRSGNKRIKTFPFHCYIDCSTLHCLCYWSLRVRASTDPLPVAFHHKRMSSISRNRLNNLHSHTMCVETQLLLSRQHAQGAPYHPFILFILWQSPINSSVYKRNVARHSPYRERVSPTHILKNSRRRLARYSLTRTRAPQEGVRMRERGVISSVGDGLITIPTLSNSALLPAE